MHKIDILADCLNLFFMEMLFKDNRTNTLIIGNLLKGGRFYKKTTYCISQVLMLDIFLKIFFFMSFI